MVPKDVELKPNHFKWSKLSTKQLEWVIPRLQCGVTKDDLLHLGTEQQKMLVSARGAVNNRYAGEKAILKTSRLVRIQSSMTDSYKNRLLRLLCKALDVDKDDDFRLSQASSKMRDELPKWQTTWERRKKEPQGIPFLFMVVCWVVSGCVCMRACERARLLSDHLMNHCSSPSRKFRYTSPS